MVFNFEEGVKGEFQMNRYRKGRGIFVLLNLCKIFLHHKSNNTFNNTLLYHYENKCVFIRVHTYHN
ncbi:hypothetical protein DPI76_01620 [Escherichia coli]|nr:hypothetical protein [Escherichia coli]